MIANKSLETSSSNATKSTKRQKQYGKWGHSLSGPPTETLSKQLIIKDSSKASDSTSTSFRQRATGKFSS